MNLLGKFSAIYSLEGYKYQNRIAIYVVLNWLYKLVKNNRSYDDLELQIEGFEDFSILYKSKYLSLHQVKQGGAKQDDMDLFELVVGIIQNQAKHGYYHLNKKEKVPVNILNTTKKYINQLITKEFHQNIVSKKSCPSGTKNEKYKEDNIVLEYVNSNSRKASKYAILKNESGGKNDSASVNTAVLKATNELNDCLNIIDKKISAFTRKFPGKPEDGCMVNQWHESFDDVRAVRARGAELIHEIIKIKEPTRTYAADDYCAFVYDQLVILLDDCVTEYFINKTQKGDCLIPFKKFYDCIFVDWANRHDSVEFKYYLLRKKIKDCFNSYVHDQCSASNCNTCSNSANCNLFNQAKIIQNKEPDEMNKIINNMVLNINVDRTNLPRDETVKYQLIESLKVISKLKLNDQNVVAANSDTDHYWLTLDESHYSVNLKRNLDEYIADPQNKDLLFEYNTLITDHLDGEYIRFNELQETTLTQEQTDEVNSLKKNGHHNESSDIFQPQVLRLIKTETARGEIK